LDVTPAVRHNPDMTDIPEHILAQVHELVAEGEPIEHIAFLLRLSQDVVEAELREPTVSPPSVTTTDKGEGSLE
jgi:hypothetical protein